jgi:AGZA family xanthine/uracil permease-like MFS transporter
VFIQSFVLMLGGYRAYHSCHAAPLIGTLAGVPSLYFHATGPGNVLVADDRDLLRDYPPELVRGVRYFQGIPAGLVALALGSLIAWGSTAFGLYYGGMSLAKLGQSVSNFGFSFPLPAVGHVFSGFEFLGVILVTAIPFGIYDLVEALDC